MKVEASRLIPRCAHNGWLLMAVVFSPSLWITGLAREVKHLTKTRQYFLYLLCFVPQLRLSVFYLTPGSLGEVRVEWVCVSSKQPCQGVGTLI